MTKKPVAAHLGTCLHFAGTIGPGAEEKACCGAGVNYTALVGHRGFGWMTKLPCVTTAYTKDPVFCDKKQLPTPEQVKKYEAWLSARFVAIQAALVLCREKAKNKRGVRGTIDCPECGGVLHFSIALNNHCWGDCETPNCLTWRQ